MQLERTQETANPPPERKFREPRGPSDVQESVRRFTVEERRRLADFFVLLDSMDRAHAARRERKVAA